MGQRVFHPWPGHPCAGHGCDGCKVCQAGGCCGQHGSAVSVALDGIDDLRHALTQVVAEGLNRPLDRVDVSRWLVMRSPPRGRVQLWRPLDWLRRPGLMSSTASSGLHHLSLCCPTGKECDS